MLLPLLYLLLTSVPHTVQFESFTPSLSWVVKILNSCSRIQTNLWRVSLLITDPTESPNQKKKESQRQQSIKADILDKQQTVLLLW